MPVQKKWGFGFGTVFSLIVVYFIFLYSRDKGWAFLAFISRWYLIIVGGLLALSLAIVLLIILFSLAMLLIAMIRLRSINSKRKKQNTEKYIEAEYKVKE